MASYDQNDPIVAEARQRLAKQNGKASMLPAMIEKVRAEKGNGQPESKRGSAYDVYEGNATDATANNNTQLQRGADGTIYRYNPQHDVTTIEMSNGQQATKRGDARPNAMDQYLDDILADAGMGGKRGGNQSAAQGTGNSDGQYNAPVTPVTREELPEIETTQTTDTTGDADQSSWLKEAAAVGLGGAGAMYLYNKYIKGDGKAPNGETTDVPATTVNEAEKTGRNVVPVDGSTEVTDYDSLTANADDRVNAAHGNPERDNQIRAYIADQQSKPNNIEGLIDDFSGGKQLSATETPEAAGTTSDTKGYLSETVQRADGKGTTTREDVMTKAAKMTNTREAVNYLKEHGIDVQNDATAQRVFADIANRNRAASKAAGKAARSATRGAF